MGREGERKDEWGGKGEGRGGEGRMGREGEGRGGEDGWGGRGLCNVATVVSLQNMENTHGETN